MADARPRMQTESRTVDVTEFGADFGDPTLDGVQPEKVHYYLWFAPVLILVLLVTLHLT